MKGKVEPGKLCLVLPQKTPTDWDNAVVLVVKKVPQTLDAFVVLGTAIFNDQWWIVEATDSRERWCHHCDKPHLIKSIAASEQVLMPLDPPDDLDDDVPESRKTGAPELKKEPVKTAGKRVKENVR